MGTMQALEKLILMPLKNSSEICYELFEDKKAIKFTDKHFDDKWLINRYMTNIIDWLLIHIMRLKVHLKVGNV